LSPPIPPLPCAGFSLLFIKKEAAQQQRPLQPADFSR
jgi:hypothetical protein